MYDVIIFGNSDEDFKMLAEGKKVEYDSHVDMNIPLPLSKIHMSKTENKHIYPQPISTAFSGGKGECKF